jgi:uncharacterized membrane protein
MEPALVEGILWVVFGATHVGLATRRVRAALVARLGDFGFSLFFSAVASALWALAIGYYAAHHFEGAPGLALGAALPLRAALIAAAVVGILLMIGGLSGYPEGPYDLFAKRVREPRGLERITRHPFFAGLVLFSSAHFLLATRLVGAVLFAGLAIVAAVGALHQDRKLLARLGPSHGEYIAATSAIPFAAVVSGRQRIAWRELPLGALSAGAVIALALRAVHDGIFAYGGAFVIWGVIAMASAVGVVSGWRARRSSSRVRRANAAA